MDDDAMDSGGEARRAVVVGAGIAGLATALGLHRAGWEVLVVERASARRSSGYLVNLLGPGYEAAERLGVLPALLGQDLGVFTSILVAADGRPKVTVPAALAQAALGARVLTVFRGDLESVLYEAVDEVAVVRFGTTVDAITQDADRVHVGLSDGTTEHVELLVGADGLHSGIRKILFGPEIDYRVDLQHVVAAFPVPGESLEVPQGAGATFIGPGRTTAVINLGPGRSSAFFTYRATDPRAELARGPAPALAAAFGDLGGSVPQVLRHLAADPARAYFDAADQIVMGTWRRGRVVLLGDAAWCPTVFAGYGATLALTGADRLSAALEESADDVPAAPAHWEASLCPEVRRRQGVARKGMTQYAPPTRAHVWAHELTIRAIGLPGMSGLIRRSVQRANQNL